MKSRTTRLVTIVLIAATALFDSAAAFAHSNAADPPRPSAASSLKHADSAAGAYVIQQAGGPCSSAGGFRLNAALENRPHSTFSSFAPLRARKR